MLLRFPPRLFIRQLERVGMSVRLRGARGRPEWWMVDHLWYEVVDFDFQVLLVTAAHLCKNTKYPFANNIMYM